MAWLISALLLAFFSFTCPLHVPTSHTVHEERRTIPQRWARQGRVAPAAHLPVRIGLTQRNLHVAEDYLMDVADPGSPNYGKHWTAEQVIDSFSPSQESTDAVRNWLITSGVVDEHSITISENKAWLAFYATAESMESLLHTEYWEFEDRHTGGVLPACDHYHVPKDIQKHIDYISPGIKLVAPSRRAEASRRGEAAHADRSDFLHARADRTQNSQLPKDLKHCDESLTPTCIAALYKIPRGQLAHPNNSLGLFEEGLQHWDQRDLNSFFANYASWIPKGTHPSTDSIDGGVSTLPSNKTLEMMVDLDVSYPIVYPQTITIWDDDDPHYQSFHNDTYKWGFNTLLDAIDGSYCTYCAFGECGDLKGLDPVYPDPAKGGYRGKLQCGVFKPPNVLAFSYAGTEAEVPVAYQKRQCNEFLKLGLQGVSLLFASGDSGVAGQPLPHVPEPVCLVPQSPSGRVFNPTWPCNCPWVTSVGATQVPFGQTVLEPESVSVLDAYSSGGGFSNIYPRPAYQNRSVHTYFTEHDPPYPYYTGLVENSRDVYQKLHVGELVGSSKGRYNRDGRSMPDVAANGLRGAIFANGTDMPSRGDGTSMSTPIFAAVINRINEERLHAGKSVLGFLNPALYAHPGMLNDITEGSNRGCGTKGFEAVKGWDPATGLGTANYPKMLDYFLSLP